MGKKPRATASSRLLDGRPSGYSDNRDHPGDNGASRLSPHLRFGEISPRQVWHAVSAGRRRNPALDRGAAKFLTELTWRDFCYQLLFDIPRPADQVLTSAFGRMPWSRSENYLTAWQHGLTGYPIVDAGMRQLWQTGWMHNRVRMIAASLLIKHLLVDWREGEALVLGYAGGCRPGQQRLQLAMGGRIRPRFVAVPSHLQPGYAG